MVRVFHMKSYAKEVMKALYLESAAPPVTPLNVLVVVHRPIALARSFSPPSAIGGVP